MRAREAEREKERRVVERLDQMERQAVACPQLKERGALQYVITL